MWNILFQQLERRSTCNMLSTVRGDRLGNNQHIVNIWRGLRGGFANSPNSIPPERVFSILNDTFVVRRRPGQLARRLHGALLAAAVQRALALARVGTGSVSWDARRCGVNAGCDRGLRPRRMLPWCPRGLAITVQSAM